MPPRFAHDDNYLYHTGSFFGMDDSEFKPSKCWSSEVGHQALRTSIANNAETGTKKPLGITRVNVQKIDEEKIIDLAFEDVEGDEI